MTQPGLSVMLGMLAENEDSAEAFKDSIGKKITDIDFSDERLILSFADGSRLQLSDEGQSCCESRYMTTNDDLPHFVGAALLDGEVSEGADGENDYGEVHEHAFLRLKTDKGILVVETHNEHNGYYGGFLVRAKLLHDETE